MYGKLQKALNDIVNGMVMASLDAGTEVTAKLQPNSRKRATIHTGTRVQDLLAAVQAAWEGDPNGKKGDGVKTLVASMSPTSADRTSQALHTAIAAAKQLPPSLADASPAQLRRTHKAVAKLSRELDAEIATELGVRLQVSDSDGDS
jgi:hypothetical protein